MIDDPNNPPKAESERNEQHSNEKRYWRSPLIDSELDNIESERKKDPDKLRMKLTEDRDFLWSLRPETLLEVIDQYYELNDNDGEFTLQSAGRKGPDDQILSRHALDSTHTW